MDVENFDLNSGNSNLDALGLGDDPLESNIERFVVSHASPLRPFYDTFPESPVEHLLLLSLSLSRAPQGTTLEQR